MIHLSLIIIYDRIHKGIRYDRSPNMPGTRKNIRLYALSTCPACGKVKKYLKEQGIECEIIDVDLLEGGEQWAITKEVKKHNPYNTYPTLIVEKVIIGYDEEAIKEALEE
jgi:glutaredoxin-like protein NrdH